MSKTQKREPKTTQAPKLLLKKPPSAGMGPGEPEKVTPYQALKEGFNALCQQYEQMGKQLTFLSECFQAHDHLARQPVLEELSRAGRPLTGFPREGE